MKIKIVAEGHFEVGQEFATQDGSKLTNVLAMGANWWLRNPGKLEPGEYTGLTMSGELVKSKSGSQVVRPSELIEGVGSKATTIGKAQLASAKA